MEVDIDRAPTAPHIVAFTYGPLVLAGALGKEGLAPGDDIVVNEREYGKYNDTPFTPPTISGVADEIAGNVRRGSAPLEFFIASAEQKPIRLVPYHQIAHERYATYWEVKPALL